MSFNGIIPIADIGRAARAEAEVDRDEGEIGGEDKVELILFGKVGPTSASKTTTQAS